MSEIPFQLKLIQIENPDDLNFILGQSHFIKTVEDLHEAVVGAIPGAKFGLAFCESSGAALVRSTGTDEALKELAERNALALGAGHCFILFLRDAFPINILNTIQAVPEVAGSLLCDRQPGPGDPGRERARPRHPGCDRRHPHKGHRRRGRRRVAEEFPAKNRIQGRLKTQSMTPTPSRNRQPGRSIQRGLALAASADHRAGPDRLPGRARRLPARPRQPPSKRP